MMMLFSAPTAALPAPSKDTPSVPDNEAADKPRRAFHVAFSPDAGKDDAAEHNISDAFDVTESPAQDDGIEIEITRSSVELDVLPIELISLTDR